MDREAKRAGRPNDEERASAAEQVYGMASGRDEETAQKNDADAEWLAITTGDPALYIKDAE